MVTPLPGATPTKPGSATLPFFGVDTAVLDPQTGKELTNNDVSGVLAIRRPWPGMARTVYVSSSPSHQDLEFDLKAANFRVRAAGARTLR